MNRTLNVAIIAAVAVLSGLTASSTAAHTAPGFSMEVLVNGVPVTEYPARGTTYVEAIPEAEYSIRLTNSSPVRVAVALSVDGLNTIDARTTSAREARASGCWTRGRRSPSPAGRPTSSTPVSSSSPPRSAPTARGSARPPTSA